jgi:uncharacterized membrane protein
MVVARALHVLCVVIWIGGVSMATTVALPAVRRGDLGGNWLTAFQAIERRFAWQARWGGGGEPGMVDLLTRGRGH